MTGGGCIPLQYLTFLAWYEVEIRTNDTPCKMMTYDDIWWLGRITGV